MVTGSLRHCGSSISISGSISPMSTDEATITRSTGIYGEGNDHRFAGVESLYGKADFAKIQGASVCVVGLGGVGSWCAEALARMGIGAITLVDLDDVCVTNINRQIQALTSTVGASKCTLLSERIHDINPQCKVRSIGKFFTHSTMEEILSHPYDVIIDAIDDNAHKTLLIGECYARSIPVVTVGSGGNRTDHTSIVVQDLARTEYDPLLQIVRKRLRQRFKFPKGGSRKFNIPCVYAPLQRLEPRVVRNACTSSDKTSRKSCNDGLGSSVVMTGVMGLMAVGEVVRMVTSQKIDEKKRAL